MGYVEVHGVDVEEGRVSALRVRLTHLPPRTIDRDTAIAWMRDGHSLIPIRDGKKLPALQLVVVDTGDRPSAFMRNDHVSEAADELPELPSVSAAAG